MNIKSIKNLFLVICRLTFFCGLTSFIFYGCAIVKPPPTPPGHPKPYKIGRSWYKPLPHARGFSQRGKASWYGSIKENKLWYKENIVFPSSGVYTLRLSHAMRKNGNIDGIVNLEGITDVGYEIVKSND